jgi:leucyl-tRNA synthetase
MFPYPSGRIHMGHVRNYTMGDVVARYKAAQGFRAAPDGLGRLRHAGRERGDGGRPPQGLDLRQHRRHARADEAAGPVDRLVREFATCDPEYYGQQQAMFLDFLEAGLVYRKARWSTGTRWT